jgi:hypothetical protein
MEKMSKESQRELIKDISKILITENVTSAELKETKNDVIIKIAKEENV